MQHTAAKLLKKIFKKKKEKASQYDGSFPPCFTGSRSSAVCLCLSAVPKHRRQPVLLWHWATVQLSLQPQRLELMTMWTVVIPRELPSAAAGGPCLDRDFLSMSLSLSLSHGASERGRQAGRKQKSVYSNYLAETLPATPPTHTHP